MEGGAGHLLRRAMELNADLDAGFTITLDDVSSELYSALMVFRAERNQYEREKAESDQKNASQAGSHPKPTLRRV